MCIQSYAVWLLLTVSLIFQFEYSSLALHSLRQISRLTIHCNVTCMCMKSCPMCLCVPERTELVLMKRERVREKRQSGMTYLGPDSFIHIMLLPMTHTYQIGGHPVCVLGMGTGSRALKSNSNYR